MSAEIYADDPEYFGTDFLMTGVLAAGAAVALSGDNPAFQNNLSRLALDGAMASGAVNEAASVMAAVHGLEPANVNYLSTINALRGNSAYANVTARPYCEVDFRCQDTCPKSIIGGLMSVTC